MDLLIHWFIDSSTYSFLPFLLPSFLPSLLPSFLCAFMHSVIRSFVHPSIHSEHSEHWEHWFIHSFVHSFMNSFIHSLIHSFIHSLIHSFVRSFVHSFLMRPSIHSSCVHPSIHPSILRWFIGSLAYWFIGLLVRSVTCARILSCHAVGISTTICSFVDARDKFNSSLLLHLKKRSCRPLFFYHHFMPFLQERLNIPSEHTPTLGHAGFIWFLLFGYCTQNILVISVSKLYIIVEYCRNMQARGLPWKSGINTT